MVGSDTNKTQSNLTKPPAAPGRPGVKATASAWPASGISVIGNDLTILGEKITIISQNKLRVDGHVQGDVHGKQVVISKDGSVTGKVCAEKIDVRGGVSGSIRALTVALHETAKVDGDIVHQTLSISEGAEFDGRAQRSKNSRFSTPKPLQVSRRTAMAKRLASVVTMTTQISVRQTSLTAPRSQRQLRYNRDQVSPPMQTSSSNGSNFFQVGFTWRC